MKLDTPSITLLVVGLLVTGLGIGFYLYGVSRAGKHAFTMNVVAWLFMLGGKQALPDGNCPAVKCTLLDDRSLLLTAHAITTARPGGGPAWFNRMLSGVGPRPSVELMLGRPRET